MHEGTSTVKQYNQLDPPSSSQSRTSSQGNYSDDNYDEDFNEHMDINSNLIQNQAYEQQDPRNSSNYQVPMIDNHGSNQSQYPQYYNHQGMNQNKIANLTQIQDNSMIDTAILPQNIKENNNIRKSSSRGRPK